MMILPENSAWRIFPRWYRVLGTKILPPNKSVLKKHLLHQDQRGSLMLLPGNLLGPKVLHPSGKERRHHCLSYDLGAIFLHPKQLSPFPERLELLFQVKRSFQASRTLSPRSQTISLRGYRQTLMLPWYDVWSMFNKPLQIFARHQKGDTIHLLRHTASTKNLPNRSPVQKRPSIYNWNRGPRRGKGDAFEKHIAGKWHAITLQEASEYVDHDILIMNRKKRTVPVNTLRPV